jgi:serine O-acetyltransferase
MVDRMTFKDLRYLWWSDLYRVSDGRVSRRRFFVARWSTPGFRYLYWHRLETYLLGHPARKHILLPLLLFVKLMRRHNSFKFGFQIGPGCNIGPGLHLSHWGSVVVNWRATVGRNCNLSHDVTIGMTSRGDRAGVPEIGDNVYIGPGAKIFGGIKIGNDVAIGANAVVTRDVADRSVVVGAPARQVSVEGSEGYVNHTDYPNEFTWYDGPLK